MNTFQYLNDSSFYLTKGQQGKILLCAKSEGVSFVFFYSTKCPNCSPGMEVFRKLKEKFTQVKFCVVNINENPNIIQKSNTSCTPIEYVPYLVLYYNGKPFLRYDGEIVLEDLITFLVEVMKRIESKVKFSKSSTTEESDIPDYAGGVPYNVVCNKNKCYIKYSNAYGNNPQ